MPNNEQSYDKDMFEQQHENVSTEANDDFDENKISDNFVADVGDDVAFYILDICEDLGLVHLFGRILTGNSSTKKSESCMVTVRNLMRCLFFKVNMDLVFNENGNLVDGNEKDAATIITCADPLYQRHFMRLFHSQLEVIRKSYGIKKIKYKLVKRKLLRYGPSTEELYVKVCYPFANVQLSEEHFAGPTWQNVYGSTTTATECLLIKRKIKGPCWLRLIGARKVAEPISTCKFEMEIYGHKSIHLWVNKSGYELSAPYLSIAAVSCKSIFTSPSHPEV